jgi:glyoxylase-like metal-dependent hydrolase (beta-lactamase superfamily II)
VDVASEWFDRRRVDERTWHLWERHVHPFLRCNVWLVRGRDRSLLVDTGLGVVSLHEAARDLFDQPIAAVATHHHFDHVGSLHEFSERYAHPEAAPYLAGTKAMGGALNRAGFGPDAWQYFTDAGYELDDDLLDELPDPNFDVDAYAVVPCPANHAVVEGDVIDLGAVAYEVLHLPGHSPDSIGLFDRADGTLFSGDAIYDGPLLEGFYDGGPEAYVATMERLRELPVRVVHGGHEKSFGRERLVEICDAFLAGRRSQPQ